MEMQSYDEDLWANPFFVKLQQDNPSLYSSASRRGWLIAIPRADSLANVKYSEALFLTHILLPADEEAGLWKTLSNKEVTIKNNVIKTGVGFSQQIEVAILFEETFYTSSDTSYRVLCITHSLEGSTREGNVEKPSAMQITSLEDCTTLLWGQTGNQKTCRNLQQLMDLFNQTCVRLEGENLHHQVDAANVLFTKAMQIVLKDSTIKKLANGCINFMDTVKLAVETYILHGVFGQVFRNVLLCMGRRDSKLNKITRNLKDIQLKQLGVRAEFGELIPGARREFYGIPQFTTPLGKLNCVRRMMSALTDVGSVNSQRNGGEPLALTSDDLLPILVFLIIKSDIPNWWANFVYMKYFRFSKSGNDDEYGFYLATLEAALDYVMRGDAISLTNSPSPTSNNAVDFSVGVIEPIWKAQDSVETKTLELFKCVAEDDTREVENLLNGQAPALEDIKGQLCHPLCECSRCSKLVAKTQIDPSLVTTYSRDNQGCTVLHVAAQKGYTEMTDLLIQHGAVVNATDYQGMTPLHQACQKGHQAVTLLLLHYKAQVNLQDNEGSTPLHLATANGHAECVKALVYYDQGATTLHMHLANDMGETALHLAAKWGYEYLVEILLENGSSVKVENRKRQTPLHVAHNLRVAYRLRQALREETERQERTTQQRRPSKTARARNNSVSSLAGSVVATEVGTPPGSRRSSVSSVHSHLGRDSKTPPRQILPSSQNASGTSKSEAVPSLSGNSPQKKPIDKLLKSVADGDANMVKFHLGWTDEDLDSAEDVEQRALCHPLCQCEKCEPLQKLSTIAPSGLHVNCADDNGYTPLLMAALHGQLTLFELFIKAGANVNARTAGQEYSALHLACQSNSPNTLKILKLLLEQGARVNQKDVDGNTALHFCSLKGTTEVTQLLIEAGASVNTTNGKGNSPLHEAARWSFLPICKLLLDHGASLAPNRQNLTPLQLAQDPEIVKLLSGVQASSPEGQGSKSQHSPDKVASKSELKRSVSSGSRTSREYVEDHSKLKEVFDALEDKDLALLQEISTSIQQFDKASGLRPTITRDRSHPRLSDFMGDVKVTEEARSADMRDRQMRSEAVMEEAREMLEHNRGGFVKKKVEKEKEHIGTIQEELLDITPMSSESEQGGGYSYLPSNPQHSSSVMQNSAEECAVNKLKGDDSTMTVCEQSMSPKQAELSNLRVSESGHQGKLSSAEDSPGNDMTTNAKTDTAGNCKFISTDSSASSDKSETQTNNKSHLPRQDNSLHAGKVVLEGSAELGTDAVSEEVTKSESGCCDSSNNSHHFALDNTSSDLCSSDDAVAKSYHSHVKSEICCAKDESSGDVKDSTGVTNVSSSPKSNKNGQNYFNPNSPDKKGYSPDISKVDTNSQLISDTGKSTNPDLIRSPSVISSNTDSSDFDLFTAESAYVSHIDIVDDIF